MKCAESKLWLSAFLDDELSPTEWQNLRLHLDACIICSAELSALRNVKRVLKAQPLPSLPLNVMERIQAKTVLKAPWWELDLTMFRWFLPVAFSATALGALALFQWMHSNRVNEAAYVSVARYHPLRHDANRSSALAMHRESDAPSKNLQ